MAMRSLPSTPMMQTFITAAQLPEKVMVWPLPLQLAFLASALAMALTDRILYSTSHQEH